MKPVAAFFTLALLSASPAAADCSYMGGTYSVGSTICAAGGWLEQCTIAGYWSAIGQCKGSDPGPVLMLDDSGEQVFSRDMNLAPPVENPTGPEVPAQSK